MSVAPQSMTFAALSLPSSLQRTLARTVEGAGIGLHGGRDVRVRLRPAGADTGIVFRRLDIGVDVPGTISAVRRVDHATTLSIDTDAGPATVATVEHLMAALYGLGIDNCLVEIDADELPILDGSSLPWVDLIASAGVRTLTRQRQVRRVTEVFTVADASASITVHPADELRITSIVEFAHPAIGRQEWSFVVTPRTFASQVAAARTFGFLEEVEALRAAGLIRGATMDNAVVLDRSSVVSGDLRFPEEFARHKALDLLGDLALTGLPLLGHVVARRAGHRLHVAFAKQLLGSPAWRLERGADAPAATAALALAAGRAS